MRKTLLAVVLAFVVALSACGASSFDIEGTWRSVGDTGWGQAQPGAVIQFSDGKANLYSPSDTYAFYKEDDVYKLDVTGVLGGGGSFVVNIIDNDNIELLRGGQSDPAVVLERVS
jgi:hypothetical protein